jgi:hypothetical protein
MAVTIDEARQNGFTVDVDHLGTRRNREFAAPAYRGELSSVNNDRRIVDSRPAGAIDQFPTLHNEYFLCHLFPSKILLNRPLETGSLLTNARLSTRSSIRRKLNL